MDNKKRECGNCTLCCYILDVPEYNSPVNEYCKHCIINKGCGIYAERGTDCRTFECLWLTQEQIPEILRPDKSHVVFELPANCSTYIAYVDPAYPDSYKDNEVLALIDKINEAGHSVIIKCADGNKLYSLAPGQTRKEMHEELNKSIEIHKNRMTI